MSETRDLDIVPQTADVIVLAPEPKDVVVGKNPTQQVVLVEVSVSQGIPGPPGGEIPEPSLGDEQKVAIVRNPGSGPVWRADYVAPADISPASATVDFRPRDLGGEAVVFGADASGLLSVDPGVSARLDLGPNHAVVASFVDGGVLDFHQGNAVTPAMSVADQGRTFRVGTEQRAGFDGIGATWAQVTLDATGGGTGWRLSWATGLLEWIVAGVAKLTVAADGAINAVAAAFGSVSAGSLDVTGDANVAGTVTAGDVSAGSITATDIEATGTFTAGAITTAGAVNAGSLNVTGDAEIGGTMTAATGEVTGVFTAGSINTAGQVMAAGVVASGAVTAASVNAGSLNGGFLDVTGDAEIAGTVTAGAVTTPGAVTAGSISTAGAFSAGSINTTGPIKVNLGPTPAPAVMDAGTAAQLTGAAGLGPRLEMNSFASASQLSSRSANGTAAAPTASKAGDNLLVVGARGFGASGYAPSNRAGLVFSAAENWTDAAQGTQISFQTTAKGSAAISWRWSIQDDGHFVPATANTYDLGTSVNPARSGYLGTRLTVNQGATPAPALIDPGVGVQVTGPTDVAARMEVNAFGSNAQVNGRAARGTAAAPTATQNNNGLFFVTGRGYGATGWATESRAAVGFTASETYTDTAQGTRIDFLTTDIGTTAFTGRWSITAPGHFAPVTTNIYDVGLAAQRVRSGYFGTQVSISQGGTPPAPFYAGSVPVLQGHGDAVTVELTSYAALGPSLLCRRAGGTAAAPTAIPTGYALGSIGVSGRTPSGWKANTAGTLYWVTTENWTDTANGCASVWAVTPNGTTNALGMWAVENNGNLLPLQSVDIGSPANKVRTVYANGVLAKKVQYNITIPRWLSQLDAGAFIYVAPGGSIHANSNAQMAIPDGHYLLIINGTGGPITLFQEAGAFLGWVTPAGAYITGNRTLAQGALIWVVGAGGGWNVMGSGIS